jgi:hypothetical protein
MNGPIDVRFAIGARRLPNESANRQTFICELLLVGLASVFVVGKCSSGDISLTRKPLTPEQVAELNAVMLRACERMERRRKNGFATEEEAEKFAQAVGVLADELGGGDF